MGRRSRRQAPSCRQAEKPRIWGTLQERNHTGIYFIHWELSPTITCPPRAAASRGRAWAGAGRFGEISEELALSPRKSSSGRHPLSRSTTTRGNHPPIDFTKPKSRAGRNSAHLAQSESCTSAGGTHGPCVCVCFRAIAQTGVTATTASAILPPVPVLRLGDCSPALVLASEDLPV